MHIWVVQYESLEKMMSTQVSQNSCQTIKCSNWTMHQTWHVGFNKVILCNDKHHQPRLARMSLGVCVSLGRHRRFATTDTIIQGLYALGNKSRSTESGIVYVKLVVHSPHWSWLVQIDPSMCVVDCPHRLFLVRITHSLSCMGCACLSRKFFPCLSPSVRWHQLWPASSNNRHRPMRGYKSQGLHVSILVCVSTRRHVRGMHALARWRRPMTSCINQSLHASNVACAHRERNIVQQNATSSKDMHAWHVECVHRLWKLTSAIKDTINKGLCAFGKWGWTMLGIVN